ncbi:MAG: peptidylprolyl isomerase [Planctomycetota bacterium]
MIELSGWDVRRGRVLASRLLWWGIVAGCASGCQSTERKQVTPETIVLATVNTQPLTLRDALDTFLSSHVGHGSLVTGEPAVRELAGRIIEKRLFLEEATALGIPDDEAVVEAVKAHRYKLAEQLYWKREVEDKVSVPEEEVEAFYAKTDLALRLSLIETKDRETAEVLRGRVLAGEDFGEVARSESTHESRSFGGLLPFVRRGELDPSLEAVAFAMLEPGSLSPVTQTAHGFAFARLEERIENADRPPREKALPQIRSILEERQQKQLRSSLEEQMLQAAKISIDESLLTRSTLLEDISPDAIVVSAANETQSLQEFRQMLNIETVRGASDEVVAQAALAIARDWARASALRRAIEASGLLDDAEVLRNTQHYREDVILAQLYEKYIYADITVTEEQIRTYYEEHRESDFTQPPEVRLGHIVVTTEEEAQAILRRLEAGEDFGVIAREVSIDKTSAAHGGRVGWVRPGQILAEVETKAFALPVGSIDGPIRSPVGYHVIQVVDRKESFLVPFEMGRRAASRTLLKQARVKAYADWALKLRERAAVTIDKEGIQRAVAWLGEEAERKGEAGSPLPPGPRFEPTVSPPAAEPPSGEEHP